MMLEHNNFLLFLQLWSSEYFLQPVYFHPKAKRPLVYIQVLKQKRRLISSLDTMEVS